MNRYPEKLMLPMETPPITAYHYHADLLAVIFGHTRSWPWFYNNYIQLLVPPPEAGFDGLRLDFYTPYSQWKNCPYIYYQRLSREFVTRKWDSIAEFVMDAIAMGYYVYLDTDQYYTPGTRHYQKTHRVHDVFIYGYNQPEKTFNITEFLKNAAYTHSKLSFAELENGFNSMMQIHSNRPGSANGIELISYRDYKLEYLFDVSLATAYLQDYLSSENSYRRFRGATSQWNIGCDFGMKIYDRFQDCLQMRLREPIGLDPRMFHVLWDHKVVMLSRINYMGENGFLDNSAEIHAQYQPIERRALENRNLFIKFMISQDLKIIGRMLENIAWMIEKEEETLRLMLQCIKGDDSGFIPRVKDEYRAHIQVLRGNQDQ